MSKKGFEMPSKWLGEDSVGGLGWVDEVVGLVPETRKLLC